MTALALIKPIATPAQLLSYHDDMAQLVQNALTLDVDYGVVPGTGDKPSLFKPGAEKLCVAFGAHQEYELVESEIDHGAEIAWIKRKKKWNNAFKGDRSFVWDEEAGKSLGLYRYRYRCKIVMGDGRVLAMAEGVASTLESKYIDRPRDSENTVCKMAQKRAFVAAVLHAFALSNRFTQDIEDMDRDTHVEARRAGRVEPQPPRQAPDVPPPVDAPPPAAAAPQQAASPAGRGSVYTGSKDHQAAIEGILRKRGVSEEHWNAIHEGLMGRPSGDLNAVIQAIIAAAEAKAFGEPDGAAQEAAP